MEKPDFEALKSHLRRKTKDHDFINIEYMLDVYGKDAACYNYLMSVYWKIAKYNLEVLKENFKL